MLAKTLIILGLILIGAGICVKLGIDLSWIGKLPGDINIKKDNFRFIFPLTTCLLASLVLTFIYWLISRFL